MPASSNLGTHRALERLRSALDQRPSLGYADFEVADELRSLIDDLTRIQNALAELEKRMRPFVERLAPALLGLRGCSIVTASGFIGHTGTIQNYRSADAFATHAGVAPLSCSSGKYQSVRVNNGGNRQLNRCLHIIANTQIRTPDHPGKIYYERKRTEGKTHRAAMRCLKRKLANVIFNVLKEAANGFPETTFTSCGCLRFGRFGAALRSALRPRRFAPPLRMTWKWRWKLSPSTAALRAFSG